MSPNGRQSSPDHERLVLDEVLRAINLFERQEVIQGRRPKMRKTILFRLRFLLQMLGGVVLAANIAVISVILVYIVFNKILHVAF